MKLLEVVKIAMKIQKAVEEKQDSLNRFKEKFGSEYTEPHLTRVDLKFEYVHKNAGHMLGAPMDAKCSDYSSIKV